MPEIVFKKRSIRLLPGRLRVEVYGLKKNGNMGQTIEKGLGQKNGVNKVQACTHTGRLLVNFDEHKVSALVLMKWIIAFEEEYFRQDILCKDTQPNQAAAQEVAVSVEEHPPQKEDRHFAGSFPEQYKIIPKSNPYQQRKGPPLSLALTLGGFGVLGIKQLFWGRSVVARSSAAFNLAGVVSILTGYPFLKRGIKQYTKESRINSDLLLGTSALALALVRENLVVLAGLGILQYLDWKRSQTEEGEYPHVSLSPEIQNYSEKVSKLGLLLGGATYAITRSPMRAMAVLLAANPRTATIPTEYAWKQAEYTAKGHHYLIPTNGSLSKLPKLKAILLDDTTLLATSESGEIGCIANSHEEKVWGMAASLLKKANHPWKVEIIRKAEKTERTIRTAFGVVQEKDGIVGKIHNQEVFMGSLSFMQRHNVDCSEYLLQAKRQERHGNAVVFLAKKRTKEDVQCLGLLVKSTNGVMRTIKESVLKMDSCSFYILNNSAELTEESMKKYRLESRLLHCTKKEQMDFISSMVKAGHEFIHLKKSSLEPSEFNLPTVEWKQFDKLKDSVAYAESIQHVVDQHVKISKLWNLVGTALAIPYYLAAPVVNLTADGLSLIFLSRAKRKSEAYFTSSKDIMSARNEAAASLDRDSWHTQTVSSILGHFNVQETKGLDPNQVKASRQRYGYNQLAPKQSTPWMITFFGQFKEFTTLILLGAAGLAFFTGGWFDGLAMGAVLVANAAIGAMQERKAEKVVEALNHFQPPVCKVIRDSKETEVPGDQLVPGDIVCLEAGDRVPADLRVIQSWSLEVNEAALTGESLPVVKSAVDELTEDCTLGECKNMLFMGTDVTRGKVIAVVVRIGMETEMGHLMALLKGEEKQITPLQEQVTSISKTFVKGAMIAGGLVFLTGMIRGIPIPELISTSITLAASAIPEGLPVTITIALSAGIYRMASKNALIRKLSSLETLGRTSVICSDKTGTLTKNEMTVKAISTTSRSWLVTGDGYDPTGSFVQINQPEIAVTSATAVSLDATEILDLELKKIFMISLLCNNSKLEKEANEWNIKGDPTEGALLTLAAKGGLNTTEQWSRCHEEPFDSYSGMMSVVCKDTKLDHDCYLFSKGSVEAILRNCQWYQEQGKVYPLTEEKKKLILEQNEKMAAEALRVLGFAYSPIEWNAIDKEVKEKQLIYVGMVGMIDPPKADVERSIREAYALGVQPVMITGDHPITAVAIAKQLGIWDGKRKVLTGSELSHLTDVQLVEMVEDVCIFARVSPEHKLRIVSAFQKRGHIVAMTGDGVNDSPAIKKANVGIAMGRTGTEVTKETADMILKEDHFGSIVDGVKEGRTIIGNIRKAIGCLLTGNLAEVLVTSAAVVAGMPMPLVPIQILVMNLLTDALPAMVLAINPGDKSKNTKQQDIVDKELYQKVIVRGLLLGAGSLGLFAYSLASGATLAAAQTTAFATLVAGQLMQTFSWRQEGKKETIRDWTKDRFLLGAMGISWAALLSIIYVPSLAGIFHASPLPIQSWLPILTVAGSISFLSKPINKILTGTRPSKLNPGPEYLPSVA